METVLNVEKFGKVTKILNKKPDHRSPLIRENYAFFGLKKWPVKLNCKSNAKQVEVSWKTDTNNCQFLRSILQNEFMVLYTHFIISKRNLKENCKVSMNRTVLFISWVRNPRCCKISKRLLHQEEKKVNLKNISFLHISTTKTSNISRNRRGGKNVQSLHNRFCLNTVHCDTETQEFMFQTGLETNSPWRNPCERQRKEHPEDNVHRSNVINWSFHPDRHARRPVYPNQRFSEGEIRNMFGSFIYRILQATVILSKRFFPNTCLHLSAHADTNCSFIFIDFKF